MPRSLYLRLSVTDHCNLRCRYCRPERDGIEPIKSPAASDNELLEILRLIGGEYPIHKIRVTGGEPLLRGDLPQLIGRLRAEWPQAELALTTNGMLLAPMAADLRRMGLNSINISIDTVDSDRFCQLTRGGKLQHVLDGLAESQAAGFRKIRLNAVLMRNVNGSCLHRLVTFAARNDCEIRFIELMPFGEGADLYHDEFLSANEALDRMCQSLEYLGPTEVSATAERYRFLVDGRETVVGIISTVSDPPCERCDRLRLDCHGRIYACIRTPHGVDLLDPLRQGKIDVVRTRIRQEVPNKTVPSGVWPGRSLVMIGG